MESQEQNFAPVLDHCVLPTASLDIARRRLAALGFTVAPEGIHPFGTANACVYFSDGTFLEPLAIRDAAAVAEASARGNVFVDHDEDFREAIAEEGFSALVVRSSDARADLQRFRDAGIAVGDLLEFSRPFRAASGSAEEATFRLAFARHRTAPHALFFSCERVRVPHSDLTPLRQHANTAMAIARVIASADVPEDYADFLEAFCGVRPMANDAGLAIMLDGCRFDLLKRPSVFDRYGVAARGQDRMALEGIVLAVSDMAAALDHLSAHDVAFIESGGFAVVPPAPGQGAFLAFGNPE
jgi:hypothetical protein